MLLPTVDLPTLEGTLVMDRRTTKGMPTAVGEEPLGSRVLVGGPVAQALDPDQVEDPAVRAALQGEANSHAYTTVRLAATFEPAQEETFVQAWVQVVLRRTGTEPALAWSMTPDKISTPRTATSGVEVTADLKLVSVGLSRGIEATGERVSVAALNLLRGDPTWEFARTEAAEIRHCHDLTLLVRSPAGTEVLGDLALVVSVRRRHFKVFPYRVQLDGRPDDAVGFRIR